MDRSNGRETGVNTGDELYDADVRAPLKASSIASRLSSILSSSYADLEIRDAVQALDDRGFENNAEHRRQLRADIQRELISSNGQIIDEFKAVAERLKSVGKIVEQLTDRCALVHKEVTLATSITSPLHSEATDLLGTAAEVRGNQALYKAFHSRFHTSDDDLALLTSSSLPVDDVFFARLKKLQQRHVDCQILLGLEDQTLGQDILEYSTRTLNAAFQKLFQWTQREFGSIDLENLQITSKVRKALKLLAERPTLFQNCLQFFSEARESILSDGFYVALTGTEARTDRSLAEKPIEFYAHDPQRYLGDMLAWIHSAAVSEREALEQLFVADGGEIARNMQQSMENEPWNRDEKASETFDGRKVLEELINQNLSGVITIFRQRAEESIQGQEDVVTAYQLANLIKFYDSTFSKILGREASLLNLLKSLEISALNKFRSNNRDRVTALRQGFSSAALDLSVPEFLEDTIQMLHAIVKAYETSMVASEAGDAEYESVIAEIVDPFMDEVRRLAEGLEAPKDLIYTANCLLVFQEALLKHTIVSHRQQAVSESLRACYTHMINHQYHQFLELSGIRPILLELKNMSGVGESWKKKDLPKSLLPEALIESRQTLDDFLSSALADAMEKLNFLQNSDKAQEITDQAAERFCDDFQFIERQLLAIDSQRDQAGSTERDGEASLRQLYPRTTEEVRALLT